jgi:hypothetical protein
VGEVDHYQSERNPDNARLMAAAPEMLRILKDLVNFYDLEEGPHYLTQARTLVNKLGG